MIENFRKVQLFILFCSLKEQQNYSVHKKYVNVNINTVSIFQDDHLVNISYGYTFQLLKIQ